MTPTNSKPSGEMPTRTFKTGDVVKHGPTGETWTLVKDQAGAHVFPGGWPSTMALACDCTLVPPTPSTSAAETPTKEDRKFVEEIDTILSCGNAQSAFAYDKIARMIRGRENALRRELAARREPAPVEPVGAGVVTEEHKDLAAVIHDHAYSVFTTVPLHDDEAQESAQVKSIVQLLADHDAQLVAKALRKSWDQFRTELSEKDAEISRVKKAHEADIAGSAEHAQQLLSAVATKDAEIARLKADYADAGKHISLQVDRAEKAESANTALVAERDAARAANEASYKQFPCRMTAEAYIADANERNTLRAQLTAAQERERGLREALDGILNMPQYDQDDVWRLREKARSALLATSKPDAGRTPPHSPVSNS